MQLTQYVLSVESPLIYGSGFLWLIILLIIFSFLFFATFTQFLLFLCKPIRAQRIRIFIFLFASLYCLLNAIVLCIPFAYDSLSFFITVDMLPRLLLNVTWVLFSQWLSGMMVETTKRKRVTQILHWVSLAAIIVVHIISCIISITTYTSTGTEYSPTREFQSLVLNRILSAFLTFSIIVLMVFDIVTITVSARQVESPVFRRLRFMYLVPSIGTAIVYALQFYSQLMATFDWDPLYLTMSNAASFCIHPEIFKENSLNHCTLFSWLYLLRYLLLKVAPIVIFLLSFITITQETNSVVASLISETASMGAIDASRTPAPEGMETSSKERSKGKGGLSEPLIDSQSERKSGKDAKGSDRTAWAVGGGSSFIKQRVTTHKPGEYVATLDMGSGVKDRGTMERRQSEFGNITEFDFEEDEWGNEDYFE
ncbi:hypothetical protein BLNAU_14190 [Blattamonas nauphoetae]|uniref:Uncharacterized protein n=1 Tax=Blattamonas nauphoetae TaxID=2049346 RepID=A0ABQ9XEJ1_9EUKA|nr:hypothetical protein BLNAU_14190 [Blattamonas nauphoetae]